MGKAYRDAHGGTGGIVGRRGDHPDGAFLTHEMSRQLGARFGVFPIDQRHRQALLHDVPVLTGGDEANPFAVTPNRLVAGAVGVGGIYLQGHQLPRCAVRLPFLTGRLGADEVLRPVDPAVEAGHRRRVLLAVFGRPDSEALLHPQRKESVVSVLDRTESRARFHQQAARADMLGGRTMNLEAQLAGDGDPTDPGPDQPDIHEPTAHEGQGLRGDVRRR